MLCTKVAVGLCTAALPPMLAEVVATKQTPTAGVTPTGSPTACHWAKVAVPKETITEALPAVVEVWDEPSRGATRLFIPFKLRLYASCKVTMMTPVSGFGFPVAGVALVFIYTDCTAPPFKERIPNPFGLVESTTKLQLTNTG